MAPKIIVSHLSLWARLKVLLLLKQIICKEGPSSSIQSAL